MKPFPRFALALFLTFAACGRPDFGSTDGAVVVDSGVDRASGGQGSESGDNNTVGDDDETPQPGADPTAPPQSGGAAAPLETDFAFTAYAALAPRARNALLAPHALARSLVIAHAAAGSDEAAAVAASVAGYLGPDLYDAFNDTDLGLEARENASFQMLAAVWIQEDAAIETTFGDTLAQYLGLPLRLVDFRAPEDARTTINNWYAAETAGQISEVLGPRTVSETSRFVITDATTFDARWGFGGFDDNRTSYATFAGSEANVQLPMMATETDLLYVDGPDFDAAILPFDNGFSLVAVRPDSLEDFEATVSAALLDRLLDEAVPTRLSLRVPRIEISDRIALSSVAQALGVERLFAQGAQYDGFADGTRLDDAHQRTKLTLSEEGITLNTDAGAPEPGDGDDVATAPPVAFHLDRPFFFAVRDTTTGTYLALGRLAQP